MGDKTQVIEGPFLTRRRARGRERQVQVSLDHVSATHGRTERDGLDRLGVPIWARGVRVEKAGLFQWVLVATSHTGH